jgi:hypothetical protein
MDMQSGTLCLRIHLCGSDLIYPACDEKSVCYPSETCEEGKCTQFEDAPVYPSCDPQNPHCYEGQTCNGTKPVFRCVGDTDAPTPVTEDDKKGNGGAGAGGHEGGDGSSATDFQILVDFWTTSSSCSGITSDDPDKSTGGTNGDCLTLSSVFGKKIYGRATCKSEAGDSSWTIDLFAKEGCLGTSTSITGSSVVCGGNGISSAVVHCDNTTSSASHLSILFSIVAMIVVALLL